LHYSAICKKNKKIYLFVPKAVSDFVNQKNPEFSHETRKFVLNTGGRFFAALLFPGGVLGPSMMLDVPQYACAHRGPAALPDEQNFSQKKKKDRSS